MPAAGPDDPAHPHAARPVPDQPRILIRGFGLVTPLAASAWETFSALLAGRTIADRAAGLPEDIAPVDLIRALGCVSIAQHVSADPAIELAERAAREAMFMAGVGDASELDGYLGTSKGAVKAMTMALAPSPFGRGRGEGIIEVGKLFIPTF